jgi:hypothetical protein
MPISPKTLILEIYNRVVVPAKLEKHKFKDGEDYFERLR